MNLHLPIVVSKFSDDSEDWSEPTETNDVSIYGAMFHLNHQVNVNESLYLRSHLPEGIPVEVKAKVVWISPETPGSAGLGVAITELTDNWLKLFVAWIDGDLPKFQ